MQIDKKNKTNKENKINKNILNEYSFNTIDDNKKVQFDKKDLTNEFNKSKTNAKTYREVFEKEWLLVDAYLWNDPYKVSKGVLKKSIFGSTNNILFSIFNYRFSNLITSNVAEGLTVTPGFLNKDEVDLSSTPTTPEKQEEINVKIVDYILKVEQFGNILKFYWEDLNIDEINKKIFFDYLVYGTGIGELYWDENNKSRHIDGDLLLDYIPLFSFFLEPNVINWQDSRYIIIAEQINLLNLQRQFNLTDSELKDIADKTTNTIPGISQNIISEKNNTNDYNQTVPIYRYYKKYLDKENQIKISCSYFVGENTSYWVKTVDDIGINCFPFSVLFSYKKPTESYGQSIFKFLLPAQKMIIQQDAITQLRSIQSANPITLVNSSANINIKELTQKGGITLGETYVVEGDIRNAINVVKINEIPQDAISYTQLLQQNMNLMANTTDANTGRTAISGAGSGAVQQNTINASLPFKMQQSEIETYYQSLVSLMIKLLMSKQTTTRNIFIKNNTSSDIQYKAISYHVDDYQNIHKYLKIRVKATSQQDLDKIRNLILQLWQLTTQYPELKGAVTAIDVIRAFHLPNEDELIANIQMQADINYDEIATQIIKLVQKNDQLAIQAQQKQAALQALSQSGEINQQELQKQFEKIPQPLDPNVLLQIILPLIKGNPAANLANEKNIQASAMAARSQTSGE